MKIIARHIVTVSAVLAAGLIVPTASYGEELAPHVIGGFEDDSENWSFTPGPEFPGAQGSFDRDGSDAAEGESSGLLTGDFADGGNYVAIRRNLDLDAQELGLWARSDDLDQVGLRMVDSTGQTHQQRLPLADGGGWQELTVADFAGGTNYAHFGGANDGVWHGPASQIVLMLPRTALLPDRTGGEVRFDNIVVTAPVVLPDLQVDQVALGNVFVQPEIPEVNVVTRGDTVSWSVRDFWGKEVAHGTAPGGEVTIGGLVDRVGYYQLQITAELDGAQIATETTDLALLSPFDVTEVEDSPFGTVPHALREDNFDKMALIAKMGAKNVREAATWGSIEQDPGEYTFDRYDGLRQAQIANGLNWLPVASYTNPFYDGNATPYTDEGRAGYGNFAAAVADHYRDQVEWIEIYNEFNIKVFGARGGSPANGQADYYFPLLKASYERIKAANPDITVVGGATSSVPLDWLEELFALGGLEYMDAISVHPYIFPGEPEEGAELIAGLASLIREYNDGELIPIWITEQGYPTNKHAEGVSEPEQAENLVRSYVTMFSAGVDRFFWYNFMNKGLNQTNREHEYGIIRRFSDPRGPYVPKPAYVGYATMARQLTGATYDRAEDLADGLQSHVFDADDGELRVIWSTASPTTVTVKTEQPVTVTDLMGVSKTYHPHAGRVNLSVSEQPIYLSGSDVQVAAGERFDLTGADVVVGEPVELTLTVDNAATPRVPVVGSFEIGGTSVPVSVRPGERESIPVTLPAEQVTGARAFAGDLVIDGASVARLSAQIKVTEPAEITAKHVLRDGEDALEVTVTNLADSPLDVTGLDWTVGPAGGTVDLPVLAAGEVWTDDIALGALEPGEYERELTLSTTGHDDVVVTGDVEIINTAELTPFAQQTVTVDGILDDLAAVPEFDLVEDGAVRGRWTTGVDEWGYGGPDDLSGKVWPTWDEENLYLSAAITDNTFHNRNPGPTLWMGDSIQFTMSAGTAGEERPLHYYDLVLGGTPEAPKVYRRISAGEPTGLVTGADVEIRRDEEANQTIYELALPWTEITPVTSTDGVMGLSLTVQDNDGLDRKGWIQWGTKTMRFDHAPAGAAGE